MKFSPLIGGLLVPLVGVYLKLRSDRQDPAAVRALKQHAKLYEALPESTRDEIERLIKFETKKYADTQIRRGKRKINWPGLFALLIVALVTGLIVGALISWALAWWPAFILVAIACILGGAAVTAGSLEVFKYDEMPESSTLGQDNAEIPGEPARVA